MTEQTTALIVLDTEIVSATKADQAVWVLRTAAEELDHITDRYAFLDVVDDVTKVQAEKAIMDIRSKRKAWDANRKEWGQPLDWAKRTMDKAMREHIDNPAEAIEAGLIQKVGAYTRKVEEERQAELARARKAAEEAQAKLDAERKAEAEAKGEAYVPEGIPEVVVAAPPPVDIPRADGISYRRVWRYEVEDMAKVPDAYTKRVVDDEAVAAAIKAATVIPAGEKLSQCTAQIPGIRIYYEDRPVVGGR